MGSKQCIIVEDLGLQPYKKVWDYQELLLQKAVAIKSASLQDGAALQTEHRLLVVEHLPVYTLGKAGRSENILITHEEMERQQIDFYRINRGGDITAHAPGQLVVYPILDLEKFFTDIGKYMRYLEEVVIRTISAFGLSGMRSAGETGVWMNAERLTDERKICALGVRCSRWVTMHGLALNVNNGLDFFSNIVPCGIANKQVTSMQKELGYMPDFNLVKKILLEKFAEVFDVELTTAEAGENAFLYVETESSAITT